MVIPSWLQDVSRAAQLLTRLSLESSAQASLILKDGQLYASAGELSQAALEELTQLVSQHWVSGGGSDLARFVQLQAARGDFMVYATKLINGMVLVVVYNVETPFSKIRSQAGKLARSLASPPVEEPARVQPAVLKQEESIDEEERDIPLPPLYDDVPPPVPARTSQPLQRADWIPEENFKPSQADVHPGETISHPYSAAPLPELPTVQSTPHTPAQMVPGMEPGSAAVCSLFLSCTLVTRMPQHQITGDLESLLPKWSANLCIAFGWRLDAFSTGPEYISWVVGVSATTSPAGHLKVMRQRTSRLIFDEFPVLERGNPSGDFWAPGYMVSSSAQAPAPETVHSFVDQTRRRQGIAPGSSS